MLPTQANSNQVMLKLGPPEISSNVAGSFTIKQQRLETNVRIIDRIGSMHGLFLYI